MADVDKLENVRPQILKLLQSAVEDNLCGLDEAYKAGRLSTIAWSSRNLLELAMWSAHCSKSENNAKQFLLDAARDASDVLDVPDGVFSDTFSFKGVRDQFLETAKEDGFETFDESFTRVAQVAKQLGQEVTFRHYNKLLSKFAHPTALSVVNSGRESTEMLKRKFYELGVKLGGMTLEALKRT